MVVVKRDSKSSSAVSRSLSLSPRLCKSRSCYTSSLFSISKGLAGAPFRCSSFDTQTETHISKRLTTSVHKAFGSRSSPGVRPATRWVTSINSLSPFTVQKRKGRKEDQGEKKRGEMQCAQLRIVHVTYSFDSFSPSYTAYSTTTPAQRYPTLHIDNRKDIYLVWLLDI
jgi:hypothetical protein